MAAPLAAFDFNPKNTTIGQNYIVVQFTDQSIGSPTQWLWKFDNGNGTFDTSEEQSPQHKFKGPPWLWRYIELTVMNEEGSSTLKKGPFPGGVYLTNTKI